MELYRTIIKIEILSEGPYDPDDISSVAYDIVEGDCSGSWEIESSETLTELEMAAALEKQGSDPSFILGEDWEEWGNKIHDQEEE